MPAKAASGTLHWFGRHKLDVCLLVVILLIGGYVSAHNMTSYPERFEDEGTYVSQAWAVKQYGALTHYTYWYDHPPAGWIQIAGYFILTASLHRYPSTVIAGREFALVAHLATLILVYALGRRLKLGSLATAIGALLYALSPLSVEFGRYILLDNVGLPWLLAAMLLALSPRRHIASAAAAAVCLAIAVLSKETLLALAPVVAYCLWRSADPRNRRYLITVFGVVFVMVSASYVLYAALKNELFPGKGHVSLLGSLYWQLAGRKSSGSLFDRHSDTYGLVMYWLHIDYLLLALGSLCMPFALIKRSLRPAGLAMLISLLLVLRGGYLPYPYVVVLLPFAALCFSGVADALLRIIRNVRWLPLRISGWAVAVEACAVMVVVLYAAWQPKLAADMSVDADGPSRQAVAWVTANVPHKDRLIVESALWADLVNKGFDRPKPVWLYKTETDPAVKATLGGWQNVDYVILNGPTTGTKNFNTSFPLVASAIGHSRLAARFGSSNQEVQIFKVQH